MRRAIAPLWVACLPAVACTIAPAAESGPRSVGLGQVPPPGYGTLLQEEVSIPLVSRGLEIRVTPLDESVTRVTAPDTYGRLSGIAAANRGSSPAGASLFLVSFFTDQDGLRFVPEEVQLISRGLRVRPAAIHPITPGWGQRRLAQRRTEMAVYAFEGTVDLESDLVLAYGLDQTRAWSGILPNIRAERGRARARAGIGG